MKKNNKTIKLFSFLCFMFLVSIIGIKFYDKFMNNPKKIFIDAINSLTSDYKNLNKLNNIDFFNSNFKLDGNIDIDIKPTLFNYLKSNQLNEQILYILNNLDIKYDLQKYNNEVLFNLNGILDSKDFLLSYYLKDNNHYIKLDNYSDKYIKINYLIDNFKGLFINFDNTNYVFNYVLKSFVKNLKDDYFNVIDYDLEIDNKKISVKKNILVLDKKNLTEIINAIISDLNVDKKSLEIINKYISIDQLGLDIINNLDENIVFYFNTYSSDSKLLKYEIEINNISSTFGTNINNFVISFFQNEIIEFYADNNLIASINYYSYTDNDLVDIYVFENKLLSIKFNNLENEKLASVKFYNGVGSNFILDLSFAIDKDIENNYSKLENQLLLDFNMFGLNLFKFKILDYINFYMNNTGIDFNSKDLDENLDITSIDFNKVKQVFCDFIKIEEN